jgi:hypothetical protein
MPRGLIHHRPGGMSENRSERGLQSAATSDLSQAAHSPTFPLSHSPTFPLPHFLLWFLCLLWATSLKADSDKCSVCGLPITNSVYLVTDMITQEKKIVCGDCLVLPRCFLCAMPVKDLGAELPDGRVLCVRDSRSAVLTDEEAQRIAHQERDALDRLLWRFLTFPETNLTIALVDRVHLQELFKFPGNDYTCPNIWGYVETSTNHGRFQHSISLLSGLPTAGFKATCAHEYGHTWLNENLPDKRKQQISRDAVEGFCELVSFLLMESEHEQAQCADIQRNAYTRGQILLFIEAQRRFGFNDIVDWMKYGTDPRLEAEDLSRVRNVEIHPPSPPPPPPAYAPVRQTEPAHEPEVLVLKGVMWTKEHPLAMINGRTFEVHEQGVVRVGNTNVTLRCLAIHQDSVRIQIVGTGQEMDLKIKSP